MKKFHRTITDKTATVISHSAYPDNRYTQSINSSVTLLGLKESQHVRITFYSFDIYYISNYNGDCGFDFLEISGLNIPSGFKKYCGAPDRKPNLNQPIVFISKGDSITFLFHTNENSVSIDRGFFFEYYGKYLTCFEGKLLTELSLLELCSHSILPHGSINMPTLQTVVSI